MENHGNILFCGVGGQGILLASEITAYGLLNAGLDAKKSEVHGMAQRGGSVVAHLRYGKNKVYSPLINPGQADVVVAFEMMEAVRYLPFYHKKSQVIVNTHKIMPPAVATGRMKYPENVLEELTNQNLDILAIDAFAVASNLGETRAANVVMVGAMSMYLPVAEHVYIDVINQRLPEKLRDINKKAFLAGRQFSEQ